MTTPFKGQYSQSINFSSKKRYYVMAAQRNTPFLDEEIRELSEANLDLINWVARNSFGDFAVITQPNSNPPATSSRNEAFKATSVNPTTGNSQNVRDFRILGGLNSDGDNSKPAVMYLYGNYIFLSTDILYTEQNDTVDSHLSNVLKEYPGEVIPTPASSMDEKLAYVVRSDTYVKGGTLPLTSATAVRDDLIYVELTMQEVTFGTNPNDPAFVDPSLKDPVVGDPTANRIKATVQFLSYSNWTGTDPRSQAIFSDGFFQPGFYSTGVQYFRAPISVVRRQPGSYLNASDFTDLLDLFQKRVFSPKEITYRLRNGGWTQRDVGAGLCAQSDVNEHWESVGHNLGIETQAYNSDSVTPRVLDHTANFRINALAVAGNLTGQGLTGIGGTTQPDANGLTGGEATFDKVYTDKLSVRGFSGATIDTFRNADHNALAQFDARGFTGTALLFRTDDNNGGTENKQASAFVQEYFNTSNTKSIASQLSYKGELALGKGVSGAADYQLSVANRSNFDGHVDFRGADNQFWHDVGVSGTASIYNLEYDRQSSHFATKTVASVGGEGLWWKAATVTLDTMYAEAVFVLSLSAVNSPSASVVPAAKARLRVKQQLAMGSIPIIELILLSAHRYLSTNVCARLSTNTASATVVDLYFQAVDAAFQVYKFDIQDFAKSITSSTVVGHSDGIWDTLPTGSPTYATYGDVHTGNLYATQLAGYNYKIPDGDTTGNYYFASRHLPNLGPEAYTKCSYIIDLTTASMYPPAAPAVTIGVDNQTFQLDVIYNSSDYTTPGQAVSIVVKDLNSRRDAIGDYYGIYAVGVALDGPNNNEYITLSFHRKIVSGSSDSYFVQVRPVPDLGNIGFTPFGMYGVQYQSSGTLLPALPAGATSVLSELNFKNLPQEIAANKVVTHALATTGSIKLTGDYSTLDLSVSERVRLSGATGALRP
jgi:hypothetical protein